MPYRLVIEHVTFSDVVGRYLCFSRFDRFALSLGFYSAFCAAKWPLVRLRVAPFGRYSLLFLSIHLLEALFFPYGKVYSVFSRYIPATNASWLCFIICCKFIVISIGVLVMSRIPFVRKIYGYGKAIKNSQ